MKILWTRLAAFTRTEVLVPWLRSKISQSLPVLQCSHSGLQGCRIRRWPGPKSKDVWSQKQHWGCSVYLYSSLCSWQNRLSCNTRICRWFRHVFQGHSLANPTSACLFVRLLVDLSAINKFNSLQEAQPPTSWGCKCKQGTFRCWAERTVKTWGFRDKTVSLGVACTRCELRVIHTPERSE